MLGSQRLGRVHAHRLGAEDCPRVEPFLPDFDAGLAQRVIGRGQIRWRVVRDVLHLRPRRNHLGDELVKPLLRRGARRIELTPVEHGVVGDVAEQSREDIHVRDTREGVFRELREVQHRDLAVLLLHLLRAHARVAPVRRRRRRGRLACRGRSRRCRWRRAASATGPALEDEPDRPGAGRDAGQFVLLGPAARGGLFLRPEDEPGGRDAGAGGFEEFATIDRRGKALSFAHARILTFEFRGSRFRGSRFEVRVTRPQSRPRSVTARSPGAGPPWAVRSCSPRPAGRRWSRRSAIA